jgi:glutathione synthase/RimK-type ligase-like ATP-grasp enzyme
VKLAFATCKKFPGLVDDDRLAVPHLERLGISVTAVCWEDGAQAFAGYEGAIVRSTWNYVEHFEAFGSWLHELERLGVHLENSPAILRWNSDKNYLSELSEKGVPIVPTVFLATAQGARERALERGWSEAVLKPAVSAGASRTFRLRTDSASAWPTEASAPGGWLLQEFLPEVLSEGEYSFLFFDGRISHAVRKTPKGGDYRVQEQFGGTFRPEKAAGPGLEAAKRVLAAGPPGTLYARVDLIRSRGLWLLGELELLEPSLYLAHDPLAPERFSVSVARRFGLPAPKP